MRNKNHSRPISSRRSSYQKVRTLVPGSFMIHPLLHSRYVNVGLFNLRQLFFGMFDVSVHTDKASKNRHSLYLLLIVFTDAIDYTKFWNELSESLSLVKSGKLIHRGRGKLLRRRCIDSSRKNFHIPTDVFQGITAICTRWCSRQTCTGLCSRPTPSILLAEISIVAAKARRQS